MVRWARTEDRMPKGQQGTGAENKKKLTVKEKAEKKKAKLEKKKGA